MNLYAPGDSIAFTFATASPTTGAAADADSTPTATATRNGADDGAFSLTVTNLATGRYKVTGTVPAYTAGDLVEIAVAATVGGVAGVAKVAEFRVCSTAVKGSIFGSTAFASATNAPGWYTAPSNPSDYARNNVSPSWYTAPTNPTDYARNNITPGWFTVPSAVAIAAAVWDTETADHATEGTFGLETIAMTPPNPWETVGYVKASPSPTAHQFRLRNVQGSLDPTRLSLGIDAAGIGGRSYRVASAASQGASSPGPGSDYLVTMLDDLPIAPSTDAAAYLSTSAAPHSADLAGYKLASDGLDAVDPGTLTGLATTIAGKIDQLWRYFFKPANRTPDAIETLADDGTTVLTTQPITDDGAGNETRGSAVEP